MFCILALAVGADLYEYLAQSAITKFTRHPLTGSKLTAAMSSHPSGATDAMVVVNSDDIGFIWSRPYMAYEQPEWSDFRDALAIAYTGLQYDEIDVFDPNATLLTELVTHFTDRAASVRFAPFSTVTLESQLRVTYTRLDRVLRDAGSGLRPEWGPMDVLNLDRKRADRFPSADVYDPHWRGLTRRAPNDTFE